MIKGKIIAVTGGKGGTGKSTVATALAYNLAKHSKVLLVDLDVDCPNDHLLLGIKRNLVKKVYQRVPNFNLEKCAKCALCGKVCRSNAIVSVKGKTPLFFQEQCNGCGSCVLNCPANAIKWSKKEIGEIFIGKEHNIHLISGELKPNEIASEKVVEQTKEHALKKSDYDYIIIDTSAGTHCNVISALEDVDFVLAVTEPTPLGVHDLELIMQLLKKMKLPYEVVLNRHELGKEKLVEEKLEEYRKKIFEKIPYSKEIVDAYSKGIPVQHKNIIRITEKIR